jgi:plasmid stability protein
MAKMIQIRNVPDPMHRKLKARAAMTGMSLSDYLLAELKRIAERPTAEEMADRLKQRRPVDPSESPAEAVRAERERH